MRAGLHRSAARLSCRLPPVTFCSVVPASSTRTSICEAWISRFEASVDCSSEISRRERSADLEGVGSQSRGEEIGRRVVRFGLGVKRIGR